jgi:hypothetical protein
MRRHWPNLQKQSVFVIEQMDCRIKKILTQKPGMATFASGKHKKLKKY